MVREDFINKPIDLIKELDIPKGSFVFNLNSYRFYDRELKYNMYVVNILKENKIIDEKTNIYFLVYNSREEIDVYKFDKLIFRIKTKNTKIVNKMVLKMLNNYSFFVYHYGRFKKLEENFMEFFFINDKNTNKELYNFLLDYLKFKGVKRELNEKNLIDKAFPYLSFFKSSCTLYGLYNRYKEVNNKFIKDLNDMMNEGYLFMDNLLKVINNTKFQNNLEIKNILLNYVYKKYSYLDDKIAYMLGTKDYTDPFLIVLHYYNPEYSYSDIYDLYELNIKRGKNLEEALVKGFLYTSLGDEDILKNFYNNVKHNITIPLGYEMFLKNSIYSTPLEDLIYYFAYPYKTYLIHFSPNLENLKNLENFITIFNSEKFFKIFYETFKNDSFLINKENYFNVFNEAFKNKLLNVFNEAFTEAYKQEIFEKRDKFYKSIGREIGL